MAHTRNRPAWVILNPHWLNNSGTQQYLPWPGPEKLWGGGLAHRLESRGYTVVGPLVIALTGWEERSYGGWNRAALAGGHVAGLVAQSVRNGALPIVLMGDGSVGLGVLGGLQQATEPGKEPVVGLIRLDAHADYHTPDTARWGRLGTMQAAVATGRCLIRIRRQMGLDSPIFPEHLLMIGVRDTDLEEQADIERDRIAIVPRDRVSEPERLETLLTEYRRMVDRIYVHIDLDVLDPSEMSGMPSGVEHGLSMVELTTCLQALVRQPRVAAIGVTTDHLPDPADPATVEKVLDAMTSVLP